MTDKNIQIWINQNCNNYIIILIAISDHMEKPISRLNAFQNYGQFLETQTDPGKKTKKKTQSSSLGNDQFSNDLCSASDIDAIVKKKFHKQQYPTDLSLMNIYCPICGRMVSAKQVHSIYLSQNYNRKFLAHDACLKQQSSRLLNDLFDHVQQMSYKTQQRAPHMKVVSIGDRQFCLQMTISHPLSDFKYIKLITKGHLNGSSIRWDLRQQDDQFCYQPNIICVPFIDFKITITASQIGSQQNKKIITNYINLSRTKFSTQKTIIAMSQQLELELKIYNTMQEKEEIVQAMNYKYQYNYKLALPIVEISSIEVQIPEQEYNDEQYQNSNSTIVQLLSEKVDSSSFASSVHLYSNIPKNHFNYYEDNMSNGGQPQQIAVYNNIHVASQNQVKLPQRSTSPQKQRVDLGNLISTNKLSSYVRNSNQSRIFQNFLDQATNQQVQIIIRTLYDEFCELVTDEYANYMTQKLFQVCSPNQRLMILGKLYPQMPALVKNKQGTHTIQTFISLLTLNEQFTLICQSISQDFQQLCHHSISTHFIQKIIKIFPLHLTLPFYYVANQNFLKFATDKNAMCVLKYMLRRIKQVEDDPLVAEIKKHFINSITLNTDKIIQDCYGNYVVQFCYQLFGQIRSSGITEMIIQKFVQFSLQKYSSSVVSKCVNSYWTDHSYVNRLKDSLKNQGIIEMYRNRQGNKILLDLMDRNETTPLRQKIYNLLAYHGEPSKFYHDRWGMQIGIRSGPVGIQFKNFTEADTKYKSQQSNNNNNNINNNNNSNKKTKKK